MEANGNRDTDMMKGCFSYQPAQLKFNDLSLMSSVLVPDMAATKEYLFVIFK